MKMTTLLGLCLTVAGTAYAAGAKTFTYRVKVPSVAGGSCAQNASQIAAAFAAANGSDVMNVSGSCEGQQTLENKSVDIVVVSYQGQEVAPYRATLSGTQDNSSGFSETFSTYASCLAAIKGQVSFFAAETGLPVVAAFCEPARDMVNGYTLSIDGFGGEPQKKLYSFMNHDVSSIDYTKIIPIAANLIATAGGQINYQDPLRVYYYAEQMATIGVNTFGLFDNHGCEDQLAIGEHIAVKGGQTNVSAVCVDDISDTKALVVLGLGWASFSQDYGMRSPDYLTYDECVQDRPRMTAGLGEWLLGAICTPAPATSGHYQLNLFTKTP